MRILCEKLNARGGQVTTHLVFHIMHKGHGYVFTTRTNTEDVLRAKIVTKANGVPFTILNISPEGLIKNDGKYEFTDSTVDMIYFCLRFNNKLNQST